MKAPASEVGTWSGFFLLSNVHFFIPSKEVHAYTIVYSINYKLQKNYEHQRNFDILDYNNIKIIIC